MTKPRPRTQKERRDESDRKMIDAAIELFAAKGYTKTTLIQIGQAAGCTGTLISNRFGSKEGLLRAVLAHIMSRFATDQTSVDQMETIFLGSPPAEHPDHPRREPPSSHPRNSSTKTRKAKTSITPSATANMREFVKMYLEDVVRKQSRIRALHVIMGEALGALPEVQIEIAKVNSLFRSRISHLITTGKESGEYHADLDVDNAAIIVVGLLRGITTQALVEPESVKLKKLIPFTQDAVAACLAKAPQV